MHRSLGNTHGNSNLLNKPFIGLYVVLQCGAAGGNSAGALRAHSVWLGGLFNPEAFITATRQCVAQANSWSLEELHLDVCVADEAEKPSFDDCSFAVEGLKLFGAACRNNQLSISAEISTNLHLTRLRWIKKSDREFDSI